jgi:hypothetical protein
MTADSADIMSVPSPYQTDIPVNQTRDPEPADFFLGLEKAQPNPPEHQAVLAQQRPISF